LSLITHDPLRLLSIRTDEGLPLQALDQVRHPAVEEHEGAYGIVGVGQGDGEGHGAAVGYARVAGGVAVFRFAGEAGAAVLANEHARGVEVASRVYHNRQADTAVGAVELER